MGSRAVHAVSFDAGGTLVYPYPSVGAVYAERLAVHGLSVSPDRAEGVFQAAYAQAVTRGASEGRDDKSWWRRLVAEVVGELGETADFGALFEDLWLTFAEPARWRLYPGVKEVLLQLRQRGYRLAVVSNWDARLRQILAGHGLTPFFDCIVISAEVGLEKPDPRIFSAAAGQLKVPGQHILHVGDSTYHDVAGARRAGWQWRLVAPDAPPPPGDGVLAGVADLLTELAPRPAAPRSQR